MRSSALSVPPSRLGDKTLKDLSGIVRQTGTTILKNVTVRTTPTTSNSEHQNIKTSKLQNTKLRKIERSKHQTLKHQKHQTLKHLNIKTSKLKKHKNNVSKHLRRRRKSALPAGSGARPRGRNARHRANPVSIWGQGYEEKEEEKKGRSGSERTRRSMCWKLQSPHE